MFVVALVLGMQRVADILFACAGFDFVYNSQIIFSPYFVLNLSIVNNSVFPSPRH